MHLTRPRAAALAAAALLLVLTGCASAETAGSSGSGAAADVAFAQSMIPHHEQAVVMADMALQPSADASGEVRALAEQIKGAQAPEIDQMTGWLQGWGEPTMMPGASGGSGMEGMDHSGHDMGGIEMAGMMTAEQMDRLAGASGAEFDRQWLQMMIEHHEGALAMAQQVADATDDPEVAALADDIISAQQEEIATMKALLA